MEAVVALAGAITALAAAAAVIYKVVTWFGAIVEGIRCQLRTDMLRTYYRHKDEKKIRQYEKENFEHNYRAYLALHGNSFIEDIYDEVKHWEVVS
ncbi:MAG: hypothetical protein J6J04_04730 [Oscillospiraceae bacterium]|nr:hypothetical protein [Oscillospiraceae bacterium]